MGNKGSAAPTPSGSQQPLQGIDNQTSAAHDPDENKYPDEINVPMQELYNPFPTELQNKVQNLFESNIESDIKKDGCTLTSTQLIEWLSNHIKTEHYASVDVILSDLNDTEYSEMKERMEEELSEFANAVILNKIYLMLKDDVFSSIQPSNISRHTTHSSLSSGFGTEHKEFAESLMFDGMLGLEKRKSMRQDDVQVFEDEYTANKEPFPEFINIALFGRSDDEWLEMLIDQALLKVCYSDKFEKLWNDAEFVKSIYNDETFPDAVEQVYEFINHDDDNDHNNLEFIGDFVNNEFKRQINENKRRIEQEAKESDERTDGQIQQSLSMDLSNIFDNVYNFFLNDNEYVIRQKHAGQIISHRNLTRLKDEEPLFELEVQEIDYEKYCWAVWKNKKFKNNHGIKTKGKWEIITKAKDKERKNQERENKLKNDSQKDLFHAAMDAMNPKKGVKGVLQRAATKMSLMGGGHAGVSNSTLPAVPDRLASANSLVPEQSIVNDGGGDGGGNGNGNGKTGKHKKKKKSNFQYIPLKHLNLIFELMQYHYFHSIKEAKEKIIIKKKEPKLVSSPLYQMYCENQEFGSKDLREKHDTVFKIKIEGKLYLLKWWNAKGRSDCNAFTIQIGEREYFYMRFKHNYREMNKENNKTIHRMVWDWYDNDTAKYRPYHPGVSNEVYQELEASFQANVESNFPRPKFEAKVEENEQKSKENEARFDICMLPQLRKDLNETKNLNIQCMVLRFSFTEKSNRILNIEQVSLRKKGTAFPRNVRRLLDNKNSLNSYWQNTNKFIEEWKHRYQLSTKQQQLYFWSYILCIAATMKYIEIEFDHQLISIPFEKATKKQDAEYTGLDDSDLQRHKIDCKLWDGFFMPPMNQLQTAQISKNLDLSNNFEDWYESLSRVEPLCKFKNQQKEGFDNLNRRIACNHKFKNGDILWYSKQTYDVYCNRCATLLRFSECIRKFVLETDSNEVVDFMWPWYRNYFHRKDRKKYLKYIAKYNLSHLFMIRDVLQDPYKRHVDEHDGNDEMVDNKSVLCCKPVDGDKKVEKHKKQIRHLRKFAASVLLGPWDILRNINVIKSQMNFIFKAKEGENGENEKKGDTDDKPMEQKEKEDEDMEEEEPNNQSEKPKKEKSWKQWQSEINAANEKAQESIHGSDSDFDFDKNRKDFNSLISSILTHHQMENDYDGQNEEKRRYYSALRETFHRTPVWWTMEHDVLLIELALRFNWNQEKINEELTDETKKYYYQEHLKTKVTKSKSRLSIEASISYGGLHHMDTDEDNADDEDDDDMDGNEPDIHLDLKENDDFEYRGYQEFQVWCEDWRNIQHRLRSLTFIVCKYLTSKAIKPSIVEIRIPNPKDRVEQYASDSFIFLNGYVANVHVKNCKIQSKGLRKILGKNDQILSISRLLTKNTLRQAKRKRISGLEENTARMRDPFMTRNLEFELEQICQSFDLLKCGVDIALFLIKLLARKQSESLWKSLGIVLEYMPYEGARFVLNEKREDLRHGEPKHLKTVCDRIRKGSHFSVHICLFLAEYMEKNANQDLARHDTWINYSKHYEEEAGQSINEIESDHLLSVLIDIPLEDSGGSKVPLLQVALEQNRVQFLNNERINAVLKHVWQTPSGLDPKVEILRKSRTKRELWELMLNQPFHFYLTPMGFNIIIKASYLVYLLFIYIFIWERIYLDDPLGIAESLLWSLNIGYFVYECIEAYDKGLRDYFTLAGWVNYWDLQISFTWLTLFAIRMVSVAYNYKDFDDEHDDMWDLAQSYMVLWAIQSASMSGRALVLFQTSEYFGVLLRMMKSLIAEMFRFMFVLGLILFGFVFGLYYIQGGYQETKSNINDWWGGFRFLFQLTVGAGDFNEVEDIVENQITAQLYALGYVVLSAILMMNLLIALMTTTFENVYQQARAESSFAIAETTFDLSHRSRFMPAPFCIYIFFLTVVIHILNFPFAMILPQWTNVYVYINHRRYEDLVRFKFSDVFKFCCFCCKRDEDKDDKDDYNYDADPPIDEHDTYELKTRGRVWKYYASTVFMDLCLEKKLNSDRFNIHHTGCFCCIPTKIGAKVAQSDKDRSTCNGITLNEYAEAYEDHHKFALDPQDTVLLKHLTVNTLFCKYCYKPFDPKQGLDDVLLTPFWALSELISIYLFPLTVWPLLVLFYGMATIFEKIGSLFDEKGSDARNILDHDRQYFQKETLDLSEKDTSNADNTMKINGETYMKS